VTRETDDLGFGAIRPSTFDPGPSEASAIGRAVRTISASARFDIRHSTLWSPA